jgi:hypothetical protein
MVGKLLFIKFKYFYFFIFYLRSEDRTVEEELHQQQEKV